MATTGVHSGSIMRVYVEGAVVAKSTDCNIEFSRGEVVISHKDVTNNWKAVSAGELSATASTNALYAEDDGETFATLWTAFKNRSDVTVNFSSNVSGDKYYYGEFKVTSLSINAPNNESVTYSASFSSNGVITQGTV